VAWYLTCRPAWCRRFTARDDLSWDVAVPQFDADGNLAARASRAGTANIVRKHTNEIESQMKPDDFTGRNPGNIPQAGCWPPPPKKEVTVRCPYCGSSNRLNIELVRKLGDIARDGYCPECDRQYHVEASPDCVSCYRIRFMRDAGILQFKVLKDGTQTKSPSFSRMALKPPGTSRR
jgi:hypothetical protein